MKPFIWGVVLTAVFLSWGSEKYYTYWAMTSKVNGSSEQPYKGIDFDVYYGHETGTTPENLEGSWFYSKLAGLEMSPVGWFRKSLSYALWTSLMVASYLVLLHKLLEVRDGWVIALLTLKPFTMSIIFGNIQPMLGLLCVSPWGMVLATSFKSYCAGFLVLFAIRRSLARKVWVERDSQIDRARYDDLHRHRLGDS